MNSTVPPADAVCAAALRARARPEVPPLPAYPADPPSEAVRARAGAERIARLASNENPHGPSPAVGRAPADAALRGILAKPWREPRSEAFLRIPVGAAEDAERFAQAPAALLEEPA
jgi:histidinol-phosphate/aromatic aminotransferase/cobyric acid decarboxylase-like protein